MKKVLIIEDNEQNMYMMTYLLESSGYIVYSSSNGRDGIEMAKKIIPAAILLDIQLPEMDGYSVARNLRQIRELDRVAIIAVTSYAMPGDSEKAFEAGANGYIEKPIEPDFFITQIQSYF